MYDFVIVGAGSAGCVLAARLAEDPDVKVALIEAAPLDTDATIATPIAAPQLWQSSRWDWGFLSEPEPGLAERRNHLPRARMVGRLQLAQRDGLYPGEPRRLRRVGRAGPVRLGLRGRLVWETRPQENDEAPRHVAALTDIAGFEHSRANLRRYEPGSKGRRHKELVQEETFVVLQGTLTMYLGAPPVREEIPTGGLVHVTSGTPQQIANEAAEELLLYACGPISPSSQSRRRVSARGSRRRRGGSRR